MEGIEIIDFQPEGYKPLVDYESWRVAVLKFCDDLLIEYARFARQVPFGEETVIGYLLACEAEYNAVRSVLAGKNAGLSQDKIMERLRICYAV